MSFGLGKRRLAALGVTLAAGLLFGTGTRAYAGDPNVDSGATVDQPGAILVFAKVVFDGPTPTIANPKPRDTIIQISNTMNVTAHVHCFYIDAETVNPSLPFNPVFNPRIWQETDFSLWLTRQQPTHWVASFGRPVDPNDGLGNQNSGLDPGPIPPVRAGFEGELRCVVVDADDKPLADANWIKGEATIRDTTHDVSDYNAIALRAGHAAGATDNILALDEIGKDNGGQYTSCPDSLLFDFFAYGHNDPVVEENGLCDDGNGSTPNDCPINTTLTLVPCGEDFENLVPGRVTVGFEIINEFENKTSRDGVQVDCWLDEPLNNLGTNAFNAGVLGSITGSARVTPADGQGGVLGVAEETHLDSDGNSGRAAFNLHQEGSRAASQETVDRIVLSAP
ncbi:MAG: hypothetical protein HYR72_16185 [Deltaproteobacteria bacterium]|nr:hypothetical protein [Deltaproteobacteria bacterium]MBI3389595.1 hypothetical protein [Deltaproteobacteria bacterium]